MKVYVIGHSGSGLTATCASACNHDSIVVTSTTTTSTADSHEYYLTAIPDKIDLGEYEWFLRLEKIKEAKAGWLKPHKQLKPGNNSKINYNLPRSRIREKKQIFLLRAA